MAGSDSITYPEALSAQDRFLCEKTEEAIRDGRQLEAWMRARTEWSADVPLHLNRTYDLPNRAFGYFGSFSLNGRPTTIMGCRQEVDFGPFPGKGDAAGTLRNFVLAEFLPRAHWTYPDGHPGGFSIQQSLYRKPAGEFDRMTADRSSGCIDWRQLGSHYSWVLLTVQIHDFVMRFGPIVKRLKEAACVALHQDFIHISEKPAPGVELEVAVGYPFVAFAPIPNFFGFGPGKFGIACKLYSFRLTSDKLIKVNMDFAAAPRCARVFDFGPRIPDPVYGGAALLSLLCLGLWKTDAFHNKVDAGMLTQHCRVHQALMEGTARVWRNFVNGGGR